MDDLDIEAELTRFQSFKSDDHRWHLPIIVLLYKLEPDDIIKVFTIIRKDNKKCSHILNYLCNTYKNNVYSKAVADKIYFNIRNYLIENKNNLKISDILLFKFLTIFHKSEIDYILSTYSLENIKNLLLDEIFEIKKEGAPAILEYLLQYQIELQPQHWSAAIDFPDALLIMIKHNYNPDSIKFNHKMLKAYLFYQDLNNNGADTKLYFTRIYPSLCTIAHLDPETQLDKVLNCITFTLQGLNVTEFENTFGLINDDIFEYKNCEKLFELIENNLIGSDLSLNINLMNFLISRILPCSLFYYRTYHITTLLYVYYVITIQSYFYLIEPLNDFFDKNINISPTKQKWSLLSILLQNFNQLNFPAVGKYSDNKLFFDVIILNLNFFNNIDFNDLLFFAWHIDYLDGFCKILVYPEINLKTFIYYAIDRCDFKANKSKLNFIHLALEYGIIFDHKIWMYFINRPKILKMFFKYGYNWIQPPIGILPEHYIQIYDIYAKIEKMGIDINKLIIIHEYFCDV